MTSPDLINELRASRPAAPTALRARVREIAAARHGSEASFWPKLAGPCFASRVPAGGRARDRERGGARAWRAPAESTTPFSNTGRSVESVPHRSSGVSGATADLAGAPIPTAKQPPRDDAHVDAHQRARPATTAIAPDTARAQRVSATLTVEVADSDGVSRAAQKALDLTESLGGHVVSANVVDR